MLLLFGTLLSAGLNAQESRTEWLRYESLEGRFRLQMPAEVSTSVDTVRTPLGELAYHVFYYQSPQEDADNLFYMLSYTDYPTGTFHQDSTEFLQEFWKTTAQAAAESVDGTLIYHNKEPYQGYSGHFWRVQYLEDRAVVKTKAFLVGDRYYALQTIALRERALNPATDRFFDSFHLLGDN